MRNKLYCASLVGYDKGTVSTQMTHVVADSDEAAYKKSCKIFENMYKTDPNVKKYISCIELTFVDGHRVLIE